MSLMQKFIDAVRPCKRAMRVIDENHEATKNLQIRMNDFERTLEQYVQRHTPEADGKYHRRAGDPVVIRK